MGQSLSDRLAAASKRQMRAYRGETPSTKAEPPGLNTKRHLALVATARKRLDPEMARWAVRYLGELNGWDETRIGYWERYYATQVGSGSPSPKGVGSGPHTPK